MHYTSRLDLAQVDGTDNVSAFPSSFNADMTILDGSMRIFQGTLAARSSVTTQQYGDEYESVDTGQWFKWGGTQWGVILIPGAWSGMTMATNIAGNTGYNQPSARLEGDLVRLKGTAQNLTGGTLTSGTIATVSSTMYPPGLGELTLGLGNGNTIACQVSASTGVITIAGGSLPNLISVNFHGVTYSLS